MRITAVTPAGRAPNSRSNSMSNIATDIVQAIMTAIALATVGAILALSFI